MNLLPIILAVLLGAVLGWAFGLLLQRGPSAKSRWTPTQRTAARFLCFVLVLVIVQMLCPVLFQGNARWWLTAGVMLGYGYTRLTAILRERKAGNA